MDLETLWKMDNMKEFAHYVSFPTKFSSNPQRLQMYSLFEVK